MPVTSEIDLKVSLFSLRNSFSVFMVNNVIVKGIVCQELFSY